mmetsp:Transcript_53803/g.123423  ORF Transcript_53803/g.123423 Transcript_53803/m.123423 type:complete len:295 (+) Transcript_53803:27-911(+)
MAGATASTRPRADSSSRRLRKTGSSLSGHQTTITTSLRASKGRRPHSASAGALRPKFSTLDPPPPAPDPLTQRYADVEHLLDCPCCRKRQHKLSSNPRVPDRDWAQRFTSSHGGLAWNVHHWSSVKSTYAQRQRPELYSCYEATSDYKSLPNMLRTQMKLCAIRQIAPWLRFIEKQEFGPVVGKRARPPNNRLVAAVVGLDGEQDAHSVTQAAELQKRLQQAGLAEPDDTPSAGRRRSMTAPRLMLSTLDLLADDELTSDEHEPELATILRKRPTLAVSAERQRARTSFASDEL